MALTSSVGWRSSSLMANRRKSRISLGLRNWPMKLSSLKLRMAWSSVGSQGLPAMSGNQARSSSVGLADALDVGVHRKAQRVGVEAVVAAVTHRGW
jgi:hypothetical protein